jgi:large subunit ribosomal protein L14e
MMEPGRVCLKIAGREAGKYAVIVEKIDDTFVLITGPKTITGVKRRRCNINHLEPTEHKFDINEKAEDSVIEELWRKSGLIEKLGIKIPVKVTRPKSEGGKQQEAKQEETKQTS